MALRAQGPSEFADRLALVLHRGGVYAKDLSVAIGRQTGYVSWLMTQAKKVPADVTRAIARELAGKGRLPNDELWIGAYLMEFRDDPPTNLSALEQDMGGKKSALSDLDYVSFDAAERMKKAA